MNEIWRTIPGFEDCYEVSNLGRVRSLPRWRTYSAGGRRLFPGKTLTPFTGCRYPRVKVGGKSVMVHHLVAYAFLGPRPPGMHIRHLNGDSWDCRLDNLAYGTVSENQQDRVRHGNCPQSNRTHCPQGHEYSPENLRADKRGFRACRICHREQERNRRKRTRAAK